MATYDGREFDDERINENGETEYLWEGEWRTGEEWDEVGYWLGEYTRSVRRANGSDDDPDFDYDDDDSDDDDDDYDDDESDYEE